MALDSVRVPLEDVHVDEFVFFGCFEVHAVLVGKLILHLFKRGVHQDLLKRAHNFVKLIVICVNMPLVNDLEIFVVKIPAKVASYSQKIKMVR